MSHETDERVIFAIRKQRELSEIMIDAAAKHMQSDAEMSGREPALFSVIVNGAAMVIGAAGALQISNGDRKEAFTNISSVIDNMVDMGDHGTLAGMDIKGSA